jgi:hypothetical protein
MENDVSIPLFAKMPIQSQQSFETRASWLPSFDEWAPIFNISNVVGPRSGEIGDKLLGRRVFNAMQKVYQQKARHFIICIHATNSSFNHDVVEKMFSATGDYLHGMLFRDTFQLLPEWNIPEFAIDASSANTFSIGLHSRHEEDTLDGTDVTAETECLWNGCSPSSEEPISRPVRYLSCRTE